ncbi:MAG: threonine--tRNA ligase [Coriobacteriia bacterium]|nr:threonine--tRNA ligase [Coriobacteriia bacterium]MBN2841296.1 threonine--tRNA ligase [Coriobacteriia bacterium]
MSEIYITLPDGSVKSVADGATVLDVAAAIGPRLAAAAIAGSVDGRLVDVRAAVHDGSQVSIVTERDPEALHLLRHSAAHVMAEAVLELFPGAHFGIGPAIEDGFYYDLEIGRTFTPEDLASIEAKMREIIAEEQPFDRCVLSRREAEEAFADQPYKLELIGELPDDAEISTYASGRFTDLCRGPHLPHSGWVKAFKLMKVAGAYWRGDSDRPMLQRIYGTAWFTQKDLDAYLTRIEEAEKRDHRKLGKELDLFHFDELAGSGLVLYHPKGARVLHELIEWLSADLYERGYVEIRTPHIYRADVWKTSGHWDYYRENMYPFQIDEGEGKEPTDYAVKPMNCPGALLVYRDSVRSYRDLPMRLFEFGTVYRNEKSGVVHGLMRARGFTQDDAHIFCTGEQIIPEVKGMLDIVKFIMDVFGFEYSAEVSTRPEKSVGRDEDWELATRALMTALDEWGLSYQINEGDGAFYGPKIDIKVKDAIGRIWQLSTIQVDFNNPERFDITYRTAENSEERPFMLHRAIFGSMERFLGILIEHTAGAFPTWLAPVQAVVIPIADRHLEHCDAVRRRLSKAGVRAEVYAENEPMRVKIAKAQQQKVPYMLVVGDKELEADTVGVRERTAGDIGAMGVDEFAARVLAERP